jgi:hypothetical protein
MKFAAPFISTEIGSRMIETDCGPGLDFDEGMYAPQIRFEVRGVYPCFARPFGTKGHIIPYREQVSLRPTVLRPPVDDSAYSKCHFSTPC